MGRKESNKTKKNTILFINNKVNFTHCFLKNTCILLYLKCNMHIPITRMVFIIARNDFYVCRPDVLILMFANKQMFCGRRIS